MLEEVLSTPSRVVTLEVLTILAWVKSWSAKFRGLVHPTACSAGRTMVSWAELKHLGPPTSLASWQTLQLDDERLDLLDPECGFELHTIDPGVSNAGSSGWHGDEGH